MSTTTLVTPTRVDASGAHARPGLRRLTAVELRKAVDTRAGFWLLAAIVAITVAVVIIRSLVGDAADHDFRSMLDVALQPASVLLPIVGILLVTSEWSQRGGLITFALVPVRSRVLVAKLFAGLGLALAALAVSLTIIVIGVLVAAPGDGAWTSGGAMIGQSAVYLTTSMVVGIAYGAALLASAPAIVAYFALPTVWSALATLSIFTDVAPWVDPALGPLSGEVLSATEWAQVGTALALWMLLPLAVGAWRITRREVTA